MTLFAVSDVFWLSVMNVALGLFCLASVIAVLVAVALDVRERRRWRSMVPEGWPPPGVSLQDACCLPPPSPPRPQPHGEKR